MSKKVTDIEKSNNMFMTQIYNRQRYGILVWIDFYRFIKHLNKVSPGLYMLIQIAEFIELLESVYMYDNSTVNTLSTCQKFKNIKYTNAFTLHNRDENFYIHFLLNRETTTIHIEIERMTGRKLKSILEFEEGEAIITTQDDEQLFINIIGQLMDAVIVLLKKYYKKKHF